MAEKFDLIRTLNWIFFAKTKEFFWEVCWKFMRTNDKQGSHSNEKKVQSFQILRETVTFRDGSHWAYFSCEEKYLSHRKIELLQNLLWDKRMLNSIDKSFMADVKTKKRLLASYITPQVFRLDLNFLKFAVLNFRISNKSIEKVGRKHWNFFNKKVDGIFTTWQESCEVNWKLFSCLKNSVFVNLIVASVGPVSDGLIQFHAVLRSLIDLIASLIWSSDWVQIRPNEWYSIMQQRYEAIGIFDCATSLKLDRTIGMEIESIRVYPSVISVSRMYLVLMASKQRGPSSPVFESSNWGI